MRVGFIGLGGMGLPKARNLLKASHEVAVYNRTRSRAEELQAEGARVAGIPAEASSGAALARISAEDVPGSDVAISFPPPSSKAPTHGGIYGPPKPPSPPFALS